MRTIRYGAADTLINIAQAIVDLIHRLKGEFNKQKEILKSEKKSKATKRVEELEKNNEEVRDQIRKLEKTLTLIMKEFVKKRHEDTMSEIRLKIVEYLVPSFLSGIIPQAYGVSKLPEFFIDENLFGVLKYLLQNEKEPSILIACLELAEELAPNHDDTDKQIEKSLKALKREFFELCFNGNSRVATKAFKFVKANISRLDFKDEELKEVSSFDL